MQQLWLNETRIDNIDQLRLVMKNADEDTVEVMCLKLLEHMEKGVLQAWLARQSQHKMMLQNKDKTQELETAVQRLKDTASGRKATVDQYSDLAVLCNVPVNHFAANEKKHKKKAEAVSRKKSWLKQKGFWNEELFKTVTNWDWVITNQQELENALEQLHSGAKNIVVELFLCRAEKGAYSLNLRNVKNITITGVGNPRVRHKRMNDWETIDAGQCNLTLRNFTLLCPGRNEIVVGNSDSNHFEQKKC